MSGETGKVPDPRTRLALRCWIFDRPSMAVRSLNSPAAGRKSSWIAKAMASPEGIWPHGSPLEATCDRPPAPAPKRKKGDEDAEPVPEHGPVPSKHCTCGIYATTDLDVINGYLRPGVPILGIVELGGRVIPATQGYRAAFARLAVVLLVDEALTEPHSVLRELAEAYRVPAVRPHSADAEDYRELAGLPTIAAEAEAWLKQIGGES
jgi:hypothetical protein